MSDDLLHQALYARWRMRLLVAALVMAFISLMALVIVVAYDESPWMPVPLVLGTACVFLGWRDVPRGVRPSERPAMGRSAMWVAAGITLFVLVPVAIAQLPLQ